MQVRAHALLKKRDDELSSAKDLSAARELEAKLSAAEAEAAAARRAAAEAAGTLDEERRRFAEAEEEWERRGQDMEAVHQEVRLQLIANSIDS